MRKKVFSVLLTILLALSPSLTVCATQEELLEEAEERKSEPVTTNDIPGWPQGPAIGAESAILIEASTGAVLYAKNIDEQLYPASITKLMCALVAIESCPLDELLTVNRSALDANDPDGSSMYLEVGEQLSLEELLYGILVSSANEACNVVGEHIAGSIDAYVERMNERAAELGCTNTHFVTTNGLHREGHYTSAHDMALIAQAFYSHDILARMSCIAEYTIPETEHHRSHILRSKNKLLPGSTYAYDGLLGSKTGFTSASRQTLVSCAERGGMRLICVIMKEETPYQFEDTVALFDYGFSHFSMQNAAQRESSYGISSSDFFDAGSGIFGSTTPLVAIDEDSSILLPEGVDFSALDSQIDHEALLDGEIAHIRYSYQGQPLGTAIVRLDTAAAPDFQFSESDAPETKLDDKKIYINIYHILYGALAILGGVILLYLLAKLLGHYIRRRRRLERIRRNRSEIVKSRATLRRNYRQHSPMVRRKGKAKAAQSSKTAQPRKRKKLHMPHYD